MAPLWPVAHGFYLAPCHACLDPIGPINFQCAWTVREREFTPFQPHRADAGAARISPGRYHNRVFNPYVVQQKSLPKSILTKAVGNEEQLQNMHIAKYAHPNIVEEATHDASAMEANQRSICHNAVQHL